tara:strand:- start:4114 stop:4311 length:198 start_codon:yes stop_codon:yes gene_type:complete
MLGISIFFIGVTVGSCITVLSYKLKKYMYHKKKDKIAKYYNTVEFEKSIYNSSICESDDGKYTSL